MANSEFLDWDFNDISRPNEFFIEIKFKRPIDGTVFSKQDIIELAKEFGLKVEDKS